MWLVTSGGCAVLETNPISLEKTGDALRRCGGLSQSCCPICRAHRGISWVLFLPRVPRHGRARLTFGLHFPYRRLILCVATGVRGRRRPPKGFAACAISSRSTHLTLIGASCIAGRTSSPSHHRYSTCSIT